jgi:hypothetical protein
VSSVAPETNPSEAPDFAAFQYTDDATPLPARRRGLRVAPATPATTVTKVNEFVTELALSPTNPDGRNAVTVPKAKESVMLVEL